MKIKLHTLTPIHIGSGEEISPSEYYVDGDTGRFIRLNMTSLFSDREFARYRDKFISEAARQRYIGSLVDSSLLKKYPLYSIPMIGESQSYLAGNQTIVKGFVKTAGRPFIPGSSVKGSLLSAMIWYILKSNYNSKRSEINALLETPPKTRREEAELFNELLKLSLSIIAPRARQGRFTNWISISDSDPVKPEGALTLRLGRVKGAKRGGELPVLYEALGEDKTFEIEVAQNEVKFSVKEILEISQNFYRKVSEHDQSDTPREPYLLRLGQGSSAYSTSLLILAEDLGIKKYKVSAPRTRKRIDETVAMGWVRLSADNV